MNTETGQVKNAADLTEEEKKSGKWREFFTDASGRRVFFCTRRPPNKSETKRDEYMEKVREKKAQGLNF